MQPRTKIEAMKDSSHARSFMILLPRTIWLVCRMRTSVSAAVPRRKSANRREKYICADRMRILHMNLSIAATRVTVVHL